MEAALQLHPTPIHVLPPEILNAIFLAYLEEEILEMSPPSHIFKAQNNLLHVCQQWASIALGDIHLWRFVPLWEPSRGKYPKLQDDLENFWETVDRRITPATTLFVVCDIHRQRDRQVLGRIDRLLPRISQLSIRRAAKESNRDRSLNQGESTGPETSLTIVDQKFERHSVPWITGLLALIPQMQVLHLLSHSYDLPSSFGKVRHLRLGQSDFVALRPLIEKNESIEELYASLIQWQPWRPHVHKTNNSIRYIRIGKIDHVFTMLILLRCAKNVEEFRVDSLLYDPSARNRPNDGMFTAASLTHLRFGNLEDNQQCDSELFDNLTLPALRYLDYVPRPHSPFTSLKELLERSQCSLLSLVLRCKRRRPFHLDIMDVFSRQVGLAELYISYPQDDVLLEPTPNAIIEFLGIPSNLPNLRSAFIPIHYKQITEVQAMLETRLGDGTSTSAKMSDWTIEVQTKTRSKAWEDMRARHFTILTPVMEQLRENGSTVSLRHKLKIPSTSSKIVLYDTL